MNSILDVVKDCDNFPYAEDDASIYQQQQDSLWKFYLPEDPRPHGLMIDSVVRAMPWTSDFEVSQSTKQVHLLRPDGDNWQEKCTEIIDQQVNIAREKGIFPHLGKKKHEQFPIISARFPIGIDRSAFSMFGIIGRGVHMTVYTNTKTGYKFWIPQRSPKKTTYPGMLDNAVAGGMATGETALGCLIREASEEAEMNEELIRRNVRAAGTVAWLNISDPRSGGQPGLMNPGILFVYDLEVAEDVVLQPAEDDVYAFHLMDAEYVKQAMLGGRFKPASASVMVDFMIRHGIITAEEEGDYAEIVCRLHRKLPLPTTV